MPVAQPCSHRPPHPPQEFPNVLTLRVRMPIVGDLVYPRNFITKIIK